jgi:hypothetical protein
MMTGMKKKIWMAMKSGMMMRKIFCLTMISNSIN